jgi:hypothetical protein
MDNNRYIGPGLGRHPRQLYPKTTLMGLDRKYFAKDREHIVDMYKMFGVYSHLATLEGNTV